MTFKLPKLPYELDALQPHISKETLEYHYGKHHQKYVDTLNQLIEGRPEEKKSLEEIIIESKQGKLFNQAAQTWNHTVYWHCMSPNGGGVPKGKMAEVINESFGSYESFKKEFSDKAAALFGSGWTWLIRNDKGKYEIVQTGDADTPVRTGQKAILTCDVWEHAYYIDYRNARPKYIEAWWNTINWEFAEANIQGVAEAVGSR